MAARANRPEPALCDAAPRSAEPGMSLAEALDRMIHRGVAVQGNVAIGLAGVDLLFLDLRVLLASIDTIWPEGPPEGLMEITGPKDPRPAAPASPPSPLAHAPAPAAAQTSAFRAAIDAATARCGGSEANLLAPRQELASQSTAKGLIRLVLTLVKLLHDVMERQALRRMDRNRLSVDEIEAVGMALCAQATEIERLRQLFGISERDLGLDLGLVEGG